ncbi:lipase/acylhydrolase family protein, partial [gut metagenome]
MGLIVFLGDSITDANKDESPNQLGYGYVNLFSEKLHQENLQYDILNKGVDGNFTEQLAKSLHSDCIALQPDYVSILIGINDIGLLVASEISEQEKLYLLEDSIRAYHEMLFDLSRQTQAKVITLEPFILPKDGTFEDWVPWQKKMSKNIHKLARNYGASFLPLQEHLEQKVKEFGYENITTDGMHL